MNKAKGIIRQGDVLLTPVSSLPAGCVLAEGQEKKIVLAWGEVTGHHHRIEDHVYDHIDQAARADEIAENVIARAQAKARLWQAADGERYLEVTKAVTLRHEEHTAHELAPGIYQLPRQVEYTPTELRRVED